MADLKIRVGATIDRSLSTVLEPLIQASRRAKKAVEREARDTGQAVSRETKRGTSGAEREFEKLARETEKWKRQGVRAAEKAASDEIRIAERAARARVNAERLATREIETEMRKRARSEQRRDREALTSAKRAAGTAASTVGRMAVGAARAGIGLAGALARGAGVNLDPGSILHQNADLETRAATLSNQAFIAGDARNGTRVDPRDLQKQAFAVGTKTGTDANEAMGGLEAFVTKTGDLDTGRKILERMAVLSKATGSNLNDMMDAAGDVANNLEGVEDKGRAIDDLMKAFAGQGKLGAVEIKNLSTQMAKVASASARFEGGSQSMIEIGAITQMARAKGGSASATQAATSAASFANTFSKGARLDAFKSFGVRTEGAGGKVRDPKEIIIDAMKQAQAHGGMGAFDKNMGKMFMDTRARSATLGFEQVYKDAGGGAKGEAAVREAFDKLERAVIADAEVQESFARAMQTSQSQAEVFNNQLRQSAAQMQDELRPALVALAPAAISAAQELAKIVGWLAGDKQSSQISGMATKDVSAAITSTEKQIAGGKISDAQLEANRVAENEAREALFRANAERVVKQNDGYSGVEKFGLRALDVATGGFLHEKGAGEALIEKKDTDAAARETQARDMAHTLSRIHDSNEKVRQLLAGGIVVKVKDDKPPGVPTGGREAPPGER